MLAKFVAVVRVEEHEHSLVPQVSLSVLAPVHAVDLGISEDVVDALDVHNHQIALSQLPREVAESLGNERLLRRLASPPARVVVVLRVLPVNEVLPVVVFELILAVNDLVDEAVDELDKQVRVSEGDDSVVEVSDDMGAEEHGLDVLLHDLEGVGLGFDAFGKLGNEFLVAGVVFHEESISHGTLRERLLANGDIGLDLALLDEWFLPIDVHFFILDDEPGVTNSF